MTVVKILYFYLLNRKKNDLANLLKRKSGFFFVQSNVQIHNRIKRQCRVKESKCKVKILDKEEVFSYVEVLRHIVMSLLKMLTIPHPLTSINYKKY
jgi:hypothetical protein